MSQPLSNLFLSIGKPVKDEYGRSVGKIISFGTTPSGKFETAFIEQSDGRFTKQPIESITFNGAEITLLSKVKSKAAVFYEQIPFIWRKDQALRELNEKRKIASALFTELHNNLSTVLTQLRKDAAVIQDEAAQGVTRCEEELSVLSYSLLHLELEHEIGKISDDIYKASYAQLQETIRKATAEKGDLEAVRNKLGNILLGDSPVMPEPKLPEQKSKIYAEKVPEASSSLPEPPVVVYVKEVGKAGI